MNLTTEQIEKEFQRQVKLCQGLGFDKMKAILSAHFAPKTTFVEWASKEGWGFSQEKKYWECTSKSMIATASQLQKMYEDEMFMQSLSM